MRLIAQQTGAKETYRRNSTDVDYSCPSCVAIRAFAIDKNKAASEAVSHRLRLRGRRGTYSRSALAPIVELGEQSQHLDIQPNQRDHQPERGIPLHVLRGTSVATGFDEVEIEH